MESSPELSGITFPASGLGFLLKVSKWNEEDTSGLRRSGRLLFIYSFSIIPLSNTEALFFVMAISDLNE